MLIARGIATKEWNPGLGMMNDQPSAEVYRKMSIDYFGRNAKILIRRYFKHFPSTGSGTGTHSNFSDHSNISNDINGNIFIHLIQFSIHQITDQLL
jgi:hypothetical protein